MSFPDNSVNEDRSKKRHPGRVEERTALLKDGSSVRIRPTVPEDTEDLIDFFQSLSPESREQRFFGTFDLDADVIRDLCEGPGGEKGETLLVVRGSGADETILGVGSYQKETEETTAEIAFAVADEHQGKGIGTLLLERLALRAARAGIETFRGVTRADNDRLIRLLENSGFPLERRTDQNYVIAELSVYPDREGLESFDLRDRVATVASLKPFFEPSSIAVVGASTEPESIGFRVFQALVDNNFQGPVYPINPRADVVRSVHAYDSIEHVPEQVDLAVIVVPAAVVPEVVDECARAGVRGVLVITAGFAEMGPEGKKRQDDVLERVRRGGMRMIGPNCLGLLNADPAYSVNASFCPVFPSYGPIGMLSQSGALGQAVISLIEERDLGLSGFVSVGNTADVSASDLVQYWEEDDGTDVILLYMESFENPRKFARLARRISRHKPMVAVKGGKTSAGERAASSHTAALAGNQSGVDALFKQTGMMRADDLEELFDLAAALTQQPLPQGKNVGIVTNSGGPGILCTDACEARNLAVPELNESTREQLSQFLPGEASFLNPVDMVASAGPEEYRKSIATLLDSPDLDALIILYIPTSEKQSPAVLDAISSAIRKGREKGNRDKPIFVCQVAREEQKQFVGAGDEKVPSYMFPETPARVLSSMVEYANWLEKPRGTIPDFPELENTRERGNQIISAYKDEWLPASTGRELLQTFDFPLARGGLATSAREAGQVAEEVGFPVAVKLASQDILHKSDVGAVELDLTSREEVEKVYNQISQTVDRWEGNPRMEGVLVQEMITEGLEIMVGVQADPQFGHLIGFGLGGIYVEVMSDVTFRMAPLTDRDAEEMLEEIRGSRLLDGYRGKPAVDREAIIELLLRVSRLVSDVPDIQEMDLNPVFARPRGEGCSIVDVRIRT